MKKQFRIRRTGECYIVEQKMQEQYGFFCKKVRYTWEPLTIFGTPVLYSRLGGIPREHFTSVREAKKFIKKLKSPEIINL